MLCARYRSARRTDRRAALALLAALFAFVGVGEAHRAPGSLTTIEWNPRTGRTEIVHRLHSHDAELGVGTIIGEPRLSTLSIEGRAHIALYVEERFAIRHAGKPIALDLLGAELAADDLLVYQEYAGQLRGDIEVRDDILRDVFPAQINQVNIDNRGVIRTLAFSGDDDWRPFSFAEAPE